MKIFLLNCSVKKNNDTMAANDYSRRSSKEIDFGDGNYHDDSDIRDSHDDSNLTEQELAAEQDNVPEPPTATTDGLPDADSILRKYQNDIEKFTSAKTISKLSLIALGLSLFVAAAAQEHSVQVFTFSLIIAAISFAGIIYANTARKETDIINSIIADFKVIEKYSESSSGRGVLPIYKQIFKFNRRPAENCDYSTTELTAIKMGDNVVYATKTHAYFVTGSYKHPHFNDIFFCECHDYTMHNPYADGILVCKGPMLVIKPNLYVDGKYRFYYLNEEKNDSDLEHVTRLMDRLSEHLKDKNFALFYDSGALHLIVTDPNQNKGGIGFGSTKEKVKNTVNLFTQRIKIAEILTI